MPKTKSEEALMKAVGLNDKHQFQELYQIFNEFDADHNGSISVQEWREAMKRFGHEASQEQVREMLKENNLSPSQDITLLQFIGLINKKKHDMLGEEHTQLVRAFRLFDKDLDGVVSPAELQAGLQRAGEDMRLQDLELLVSMADKDHDGSINFHQFCKIMTLK